MKIASQQSQVVKLDSARYHGGNRDRSEITMIVAHATAGDSAQSSIDYLNRDNSDNPASYHYIIDRDGKILRMLPVDMVAYHAGDSGWPNPVRYPPGNGTTVNHKSIGIAWANRDDGEQLTEQQMTSGLWLFKFWMDTLGIPPSKVAGHYEVSPGRKSDPRPCITGSELRSQLAEVVL